MSEANRAFYDRISSAYDFIADANEHKAREVGEDLLAVEAGERVLEIGFGTGNTLRHLAASVGDEGRVAGIDISLGMLEVARRKLEQDGLEDRVDLRTGDARDLPYEPQSMDAIFTSFTLELFEPADAAEVLEQIRRVLRPEGRLVVVSMAVAAEGSHPSLLENSYIWMHHHFPHIVDCRPIDVSAVLQGNGFLIEDKKTLAIWTMPVAAVLAKRSESATPVVV